MTAVKLNINIRLQYAKVCANETILSIYLSIYLSICLSIYLSISFCFYLFIYLSRFVFSYPYLPTPLLGQDMTQGQFFKQSLTGFEFRVFLLLD